MNDKIGAPKVIYLTSDGHDRPDAPKLTYLISDGRKFSITCTVSPTDQALVVEIDTTFEPNNLGVRVWINDYEMG